MSQKTSGWRQILSSPWVYACCQNLLANPHSLAAMIKAHIRPVSGMRILDIGCGPADILENLPRAVQYVGVDLSQEYINAAREKYGGRGTFCCLPVEALDDGALRGFDLVMGLGVIHHLEDDQARLFFAVAAKALRDSGRCLTIDPCRIPGQHPIARLLIRMDRGQNVRTAERYAALAKIAFPHLNQVIRHDWLRVSYTHHIMECRKK